MVRYSILNDNQLLHLKEHPSIAAISHFTSTKIDQISQKINQHPISYWNGYSLMRLNVPNDSTAQLTYDIHYLIDITPIDQLAETEVKLND